MTTDAAEPRTDGVPPHAGHGPVAQTSPATPGRLRRPPNLGLDRFSGLYVWAAAIVIFAVWVPDTFLTTANARVVAGDQAITAMLAIGLVLPLAAGVFDLSCAATMGFSVTVVMWLQVHGVNALLAALITIAVGAGIGALNGFIVVELRVNSFIGTLGVSSILTGAAYWVTNGQQIVEGVSVNFLDFGGFQWWGLPLPFYLMLVLAAVVYIVIEHTTVGRYLYAVGGNPQAARLAGVRDRRLVFGALLTSATVAAFTGVVLASKLGSASYDVGLTYLLPAFSAVFLGSTQIRAGRVNVLGTLVAIYLLATGVKGLQLAGAPVFVNDLFNGLALVVAVALAGRSARRT
ncbi:ABC transporter permease [Actinomadura rudentiformis]|uniref:ABC transporter permease n=1 Tax=Actinomadura rudentiformis TaxID=359158 RepID=A0A6H9YB98_9ACTN|nr:ABC transporter permease [Actinomadura rudentiformis]KAB2340397.1 ABC transporter permease [Actinomadura rudentiformis]